MSDYAPLSRHRRLTDAPSSGGTARLDDRRGGGIPVQLKDERTSGGMPSALADGIRSLSGISMDGVRVHYNSGKPRDMQAHAYAQGNDIHLAGGMERHLPHEAWHVVQQRQGRVRPTMQMNGQGINDSPSLEHEAEVMGRAALRAGGS